MRVSFRLVRLVFCALLLAPVAVFAQSLPGMETAVRISSSTSAPAPHETVHLQAESPVLNLTQSSFAWFAGDAIISHNDNADVTLGDLGTRTDVRLEVTAPDGSIARASTSLIPAELDILFDSNTLIPPFYKGRAMPTPGSTIHLLAIPYFKRGDGSFVSPNDINFTWKVDGHAATIRDGQGTPSLSVSTPPFADSYAVSVHAESIDGSYAMDSSILIPNTEPKVLLYEDHPLFGVLYENALPISMSIPSLEETFAAIPYFSDNARASDAAFKYAWRVNRQEIAASKTAPNEITVHADGPGASATIDLSLSDTNSVFFSAEKSWQFIFGNSPGASSSAGPSPFLNSTQ